MSVSTEVTAGQDTTTVNDGVTHTVDDGGESDGSGNDDDDDMDTGEAEEAAADENDHDPLTARSTTNKQLPLLRARGLQRRLGFFTKWFSVRDCVTLLSTCTTLRRDWWTASTVLHTNRFAMLFQDGEVNDWTALSPRLHVFGPPEQGDAFDPDEYESMGDPSNRRRRHLTKERNMRVKVLSLVGAMETQVVPHCYTRWSTSAYNFYALPCLLLLGLPPHPADATIRAALNKKSRCHGTLYFMHNTSVSSIGVHWDNTRVIDVASSTERGGRVIQCNYCTLVESEVAKFLQDGKA